uniref:COMM domain containing 2 n=1 Tax=Astyanax mexicanus TaxID=7994 RepID=A0A8B9HCF8_ASTMX
WGTLVQQLHKNHTLYHFLCVAVVGEFGRIAVEFLKKGSNPKIYEGAARKLNVPSETVQHGVEGLMYLLTESSKLMVSVSTNSQLSVFIVIEQQINTITLLRYSEENKYLNTLRLCKFSHLEFMEGSEIFYDPPLQCRALRQHVKPAICLKLHLESGGTQTARVLQTDPATLLHLIQELECALAEVKSNHCRRILRNIK